MVVYEDTSGGPVFKAWDESLSGMDQRSVENSLGDLVYADYLVRTIECHNNEVLLLIDVCKIRYETVYVLRSRAAAGTEKPSEKLDGCQCRSVCFRKGNTVSARNDCL